MLTTVRGVQAGGSDQGTMWLQLAGRQKIIMQEVYILETIVFD